MAWHHHSPRSPLSSLSPVSNVSVKQLAWLETLLSNIAHQYQDNTGDSVGLHTCVTSEPCIIAAIASYLLLLDCDRKLTIEQDSRQPAVSLRSSVIVVSENSQVILCPASRTQWLWSSGKRNWWSRLRPTLSTACTLSTTMWATPSQVCQHNGDHWSALHLAPWQCPGQLPSLTLTTSPRQEQSTSSWQIPMVEDRPVL